MIADSSHFSLQAHSFGVMPLVAEFAPGAQLQRLIAKPEVKEGAVIVLAILFLLILLSVKTLLSRRRRF